MPYDNLVKAIANVINPSCWKSYSGFSRMMKQSIEVERNESLAKAEKIERMCREAFCTATSHDTILEASINPVDSTNEALVALERENHALKEQVARLITTEKAQSGFTFPKDCLSYPKFDRPNACLEFNSAEMHRIGMESPLTAEKWEERAIRWGKWSMSDKLRYPSDSWSYMLNAEAHRVMARFVRSWNKTHG